MFNSREIASRLHIFKIDFTRQDEMLFPRNLDGIWMKPISSDNKTEEELASEIITEFIRCQIKLPSENKMHILSNSYLVDYEIDMHFSRPQVSNYELAKRLLVYAQSAFIYHKLSEVQQEV